MGKIERIFYFSIILLQFFMIIFLNAKLKNTHSINPKIEIPGGDRGQSIDRLFSFEAIDNKGNPRRVQFTSYSLKSYIFIVLSPTCIHCYNLADEVLSHRLDTASFGDMDLLLLTSDPFEKFEDYIIPEIYRLKNDDIAQFGANIPAMIFADGKGEIVSKCIGYHKGIFKRFLDEIEGEKIERVVNEVR